jgi:hypothetical protein
MLKSPEGEQLLVYIPETEQLHALLGKQIAIWGSDITKDGYTYVDVSRVKVIE